MAAASRMYCASDMGSGFSSTCHKPPSVQGGAVSEPAYVAYEWFAGSRSASEKVGAAGFGEFRGFSGD